MRQRKIIIYGHGDKSKEGFPTEEDLKNYLRQDIFLKYDSRYQYTQQKLADIILLSREGLIYGHFKVASMVKPNEKDKEVYPPVKKTYIINESALYENPVVLSKLNIRVTPFGKPIAERRI